MTEKDITKPAVTPVESIKDDPIGDPNDLLNSMRSLGRNSDDVSQEFIITPTITLRFLPPSCKEDIWITDHLDKYKDYSSLWLKYVKGYVIAASLYSVNDMIIPNLLPEEIEQEESETISRTQFLYTNIVDTWSSIILDVIFELYTAYTGESKKSILAPYQSLLPETEMQSIIQNMILADKEDSEDAEPTDT